MPSSSPRRLSSVRANLQQLATLAVAATVLSVAACGSDDAASPSGASGNSAADTENAPVAGDDAGGTGSSFGVLFDCPLSGEQVGEILGAAVEKDGAACSYSPSEGGLPFVAFFASIPEACTEEWAVGNGYTEAAPDVDVEAYGKIGGGATVELLVCAKAPFTVAVDVADRNSEVAMTAAETLAMMVLHPD